MTCKLKKGTWIYAPFFIFTKIFRIILKIYLSAPVFTHLNFDLISS